MAHLSKVTDFRTKSTSRRAFVGRGQPLAKTLRSAPGTRGRRAGARSGPAFRRSPGHDRAPRLRASHDARKTSPPSTMAGRDNSCNGYQSSRRRRPRRPCCSAPDQKRHEKICHFIERPAALPPSGYQNKRRHFSASLKPAARRRPSKGAPAETLDRPRNSAPCSPGRESRY